MGDGATAGGGGAVATSAIAPPDSLLTDGMPGAIAGWLAADSALPSLNAAPPPQAPESSNRGANRADPKPGSRGLIMRSERACRSALTPISHRPPRAVLGEVRRSFGQSGPEALDVARHPPKETSAT